MHTLTICLLHRHFIIVFWNIGIVKISNIDVNSFLVYFHCLEFVALDDNHVKLFCRLCCEKQEQFTRECVYVCNIRVNRGFSRGCFCIAQLIHKYILCPIKGDVLEKGIPFHCAFFNLTLLDDVLCLMHGKQSFCGYLVSSLNQYITFECPMSTTFVFYKKNNIESRCILILHTTYN